MWDQVERDHRILGEDEIFLLKGFRSDFSSPQPFRFAGTLKAMLAIQLFKADRLRLHSRRLIPKDFEVKKPCECQTDSDRVTWNQLVFQSQIRRFRTATRSNGSNQSTFQCRMWPVWQGAFRFIGALVRDFPDSL